MPTKPSHPRHLRCVWLLCRELLDGLVSRLELFHELLLHGLANLDVHVHVSPRMTGPVTTLLGELLTDGLQVAREVVGTLQKRGSYDLSRVTSEALEQLGLVGERLCER